MYPMNEGISQSMSHSAGGNQQFAKGDGIFQAATMSGSYDIEQISKEDAIKLLNEIEKIVTVKKILKEDDQKSVVKYLEQTKDEINDKKPNKDIISGSIKKVTETVEEADKALESGESLLKRISPYLGKVLAWISSTLI